MKITFSSQRSMNMSIKYSLQFCAFLLVSWNQLFFFFKKKEWHDFFKKIILFYLFIFGRVGSSLLRAGFL